MKQLGAVLALGGLVLAAFLFGRENLTAIVHLLTVAGPGLVLACAAHVVPMTLNARAWQSLVPAGERVSLRVMTRATWARESVNALLPVARIGGEIVAYRIVHRAGMRDTLAASSVVADMAMSVLTQAWFTITGLAILIAGGRGSALMPQLTIAALAMAALGLVFALVLRAGTLAPLTRALNRVFAGRLERAVAGSLRIDDALRDLYRHPRRVAGCAAWQCAGWVVGAAEIWLALHFLGHDVAVRDAIAIDALIQAISSAAFVIPGALGVQEGGFLLLGTLLGLDAPTALALAAARRLRDLLFYFPGLLAWHRAEIRGRGDRQHASGAP